jgi:hypothetical protein
MVFVKWRLNSQGDQRTSQDLFTASLSDVEARSGERIDVTVVKAIPLENSRIGCGIVA